MPFGKRKWRVARTQCSPLRGGSLARTRCSPLPWAVEEFAVGPPRLPRLLKKPGDRIKQITKPIYPPAHQYPDRWGGVLATRAITKRSDRNTLKVTWKGSASRGVLDHRPVSIAVAPLGCGDGGKLAPVPSTSVGRFLFDAPRKRTVWGSRILNLRIRTLIAEAGRKLRADPYTRRFCRLRSSSID